MKPRTLDVVADGTVHGPHVVIVGGGYSGTLVAIKLLDMATSPVRITIVEPRGRLGRGIAYATPEAAHLMNGPAKLFSIHPERPDHFTHFLARFGGEWNWRDQGSADFANAFSPRAVYGEYLAAELARAVARAAAGATLDHAMTEAVELRRRGGRLAVLPASGQSLLADHVVLALGPAPTRPDLALDGEMASHPRYIADPWDREAFERLPRSGHVLLVGSGLTMLDALVTLERRGFTGRYTALSRRGIRLQVRREVTLLRDFLAESPMPTTVLGLLRAARRELARDHAARPDWQQLVVAIRPHVATLWQRTGDAERARFLRHLRPIWEAALHRAPPRTMALLERGQAEGWFAQRAGRVLALAPAPDGRIVTRLRWRGAAEDVELRVDAAVNCTGLSHDWTRAPTPFVAALFAGGLVRPGPLGLGLDADWQGALIGRDGAAALDLSALGPALRGIAWESSTVMEILAQAVSLARRLTAPLPAAEPARAVLSPALA